MPSQTTRPPAPAPHLFAPVAPGGLVAAAVLFGLSVTPSMVPRGPEWQGLLGGVVAALGYGLWWAAARLADWLGLLPRRGLSRGGRRAAFGAAALIAAAFLWQGAGWQASILAAWGLPPAGASAPLRVALVAGLVFVALLGLGRLFLLLAGRWRRRGERLLPPRLAQVLGLAVAAAVFYALIDGLALRGILRSIDRAAQIADGFVPPDTAPPARATVSGGPASRLDWAGLGQWGRSFVASGPSAADIAAFWQAPAAEPVRVYAGLAAAATPEARARLALNDLVRLGGFDRGTLVIAMPTGSGWLDPGGIDTLEYILRGDVATVAVQYSYLSSPVSVIVDPAAGLAEAQALFDLVYRHWAALPRDARPRLYLHGLSLGAFLSQETVPLLDLFADPIDGALWVGSPFLSAFWQDVQARRLPDSPAWRPRFGNGSLIRTMNQDGGLARFDADWGPMRLVLLQYGSDPIVFFDWSLAWSRPAWLGGDRAPDLAPDMRWIPLVTLFQVGVDMAVAVGRLGYGHDYAARHYIPAWAAVLDPESWTPETEARLVAHLSGLMPR